MGKGNRIRKQHQNEPAAYELPLRQAAGLEKTTRFVAVLSCVLAVLLSVAPLSGNLLIGHNLSIDHYKNVSAEWLAELNRMLPVGNLSLLLLFSGAVFTCILLIKRKPALSLIGIGVCVIADVMMVFFALSMGSLFPYDPLAKSGNGNGLGFWELVFRYYILILPTLMLIVSAYMGFVARKKREVAEVMKNATEPLSTLTLDEEETTSNTP